MFTVMVVEQRWGEFLLTTSLKQLIHWKKMNSYKYSLRQTLEFLEKLDIDEHANALWDVLHEARWHKGIDWIQWIESNDELIDKLIRFKWFYSCPTELKKEVWQSIYRLKALNR